jgi:hypothetical protein
VRFEVSGTIEGSDDELKVHVRLRNGGDSPAAALSVEGELLGNTAHAQLQTGSEVVLKFPADATRAGVHPLSLLLDYQYPGPHGPVGVSQRAYLLLGLGGVAEPTVRLTLRDARMDYSGVVNVGVESTDGLPHSIRLRVLGPRGFRADAPADEVQVPPRGPIDVPVRVFRGTLPWASRQGVLALAEVADGPLASAAVASATVDVGPDPAWMPQLRRPLLLACIVLFGVAAWVEVRRRIA